MANPTAEEEFTAPYEARSERVEALNAAAHVGYAPQGPDYYEPIGPDAGVSSADPIPQRRGGSRRQPLKSYLQLLAENGVERAENGDLVRVKYQTVGAPVTRGGELYDVVQEVEVPVQLSQELARANAHDFFHPGLGWLARGVKREAEYPENMGHPEGVRRTGLRKRPVSQEAAAQASSMVHAMKLANDGRDSRDRLHEEEAPEFIEIDSDTLAVLSAEEAGKRDAERRKRSAETATARSEANEGAETPADAFEPRRAAPQRGSPPKDDSGASRGKGGD